MAICQTCPKYQKNKIGVHYCQSCGCAFPAKAKCLSCHCPLHKWEAVTTEEERFDIENKTK